MLTIYTLSVKGVCAENTATRMNIGREAQDAYAVSSYKKSQEAASKGLFNDEITPVTFTQRKSMS